MITSVKLCARISSTPSPKNKLSPFLNDISFIGLGFEIWDKVTWKEYPNSQVVTFTKFTKLFHFQKSVEASCGAYMPQVQGLKNVLWGKSVTDLIMMFAMFMTGQ